MVEDKESISNYFVDNCKQLFSTSNTNVLEDLEDLAHFDIIKEENIRMNHIPYVKEIYDLVKEINPHKNLGLNEIIGNSVIDLI